MRRLFDNSISICSFYSAKSHPFGCNERYSNSQHSRIEYTYISCDFNLISFIKAKDIFSHGMCLCAVLKHVQKMSQKILNKRNAQIILESDSQLHNAKWKFPIGKLWTCVRAVDTCWTSSLGILTDVSLRTSRAFVGNLIKFLHTLQKDHYDANRMTNWRANETPIHL